MEYIVLVPTLYFTYKTIEQTKGSEAYKYGINAWIYTIGLGCISYFMPIFGPPVVFSGIVSFSNSHTTASSPFRE